LKVVALSGRPLPERRTAAREVPPPRLHTVELATDAGLTGIGFAVTEHLPLVERLARELLFGADPRGVTGLWQRMVDATRCTPWARTAAAAIAGLDLALWDLKAQSAGEPLWRALGASRPRVNAHLRTSAADRIDIADALSVEALRAGGFRGALLAGSVGATLDQERWLTAIRDVLRDHTDEPALMLELVSVATAKEAERRLRALERTHDLTWVELPAMSMDAAGLERVSKSVSAAVCGGRWLGGPEDFAAHFRARSLDIVQVGWTNAGITGALQIADTAFGFELPVALTASPGHLNAHLAAALPLCMSLEIDDEAAVAAGGAIVGDVRIEQGWAVAGQRPGLGLALDSDTPAGSGSSRADVAT
jgi:L-alanine-DL-glutamate epimerase-like enolase superfamily enzyme